MCLAIYCPCAPHRPSKYIRTGTTPYNVPSADAMINWLVRSPVAILGSRWGWGCPWDSLDDAAVDATGGGSGGGDRGWPPSNASKSANGSSSSSSASPSKAAAATSGCKATPGGGTTTTASWSPVGPIGGQPHHPHWSSRCRIRTGRAPQFPQRYRHRQGVPQPRLQ